MEQVTRIRYKTRDNPPMANVPLIGYSKKYDCWVALVYRRGDKNAAINIQAVGVDAAIRTQSSRVASCVEASKME